MSSCKSCGVRQLHQNGPEIHLTFGLETNEVPEIVVGALPSGYLVLGLRFHRMDDVREFDGVLDKEHRNIVPNDVPVALLSVKLDSETADITNGVLKANAMTILPTV